MMAAAIPSFAGRGDDRGTVCGGAAMTTRSGASGNSLEGFTDRMPSISA